VTAGDCLRVRDDDVRAYTVGQTDHLGHDRIEILLDFTANTFFSRIRKRLTYHYIKQKNVYTGALALRTQTARGGGGLT
jgi:hypothetical protein